MPTALLNMPPEGLEPSHMVAETNALSPELWGHPTGIPLI